MKKNKIKKPLLQRTCNFNYKFSIISFVITILLSISLFISKALYVTYFLLAGCYIIILVSIILILVGIPLADARFRHHFMSVANSITKLEKTLDNVGPKIPEVVKYSSLVTIVFILLSILFLLINKKNKDPKSRIKSLIIIGVITLVVLILVLTNVIEYHSIR